MASPYIFTMNCMNKYFGSKHVLKDIGLCFFPGAKIGVVGDNGSGKSTLLRIMAGLDKEFDGEAFADKGVKVGLVPQEPKLDPALTVRQYVEGAFASTQALLAEFEAVSAKMAEGGDDLDALLERMGELQDQIDAVEGWELDRRIDIAADALVLPPDEAQVGTLSGGELRRVALCRALLERPDILLLDEPTNHLDAETVEWLEQQLREYPGTVIIVTHDRYFLDNVTKWILELDGGRGIPWEGNYSSWLGQKIGQLTQAAAGKGDKQTDRRLQSLERELRWIKMNTKERQDLSRSRIADYERLFTAAKALGDQATVIEIPPGKRLGDEVLSFQGVRKGYGERVLIEDLSFTLPPGAIVGVVGPNGAGKTTLMKLVTGQEQPDAGQVALGATVELAYVDQLRAGLQGERSVYDEITEGRDELQLGGRTVGGRNYVARFNFKGPDQQKPVAQLSGGERNRVYLAKLIKRGGNFLLLDEPTNDLDVTALRMLEDAIAGYSGCLLLISHDRFFLDRVCTHLLVFEGEGKVTWFTGNFQDWERHRQQTLGDKAWAGRRRRYRTLSLA